MANPNMLSLTSITGQQAEVALSVNTVVQLLSNAAASNQLYKINAIYACNTDTSTAYPITCATYSAATLGGTAYPFASTLSVPANSSVVVVDKDANLYLNEDRSIGVTAGTANKLVVTVSYEICQ